MQKYTKYIKCDRGLWAKYCEEMKDVYVFMGNLRVQ